MSPIQVREPAFSFLYFLVATLVLAAIGANIPHLSKQIGDVMNEHIAGKSIIFFSMVSWFLALLCAAKNVIAPREYGFIVRALVITPTNFVISLAFVAAAINWAVAIASPILFPLVVSSEITGTLAGNALQITAIGLALLGVTWTLHSAPAESKRTNNAKGPRLVIFWIVFAGSALFWLAFAATILYQATA